MSDRPGRYQRSFSGLVASLLVVVAVVGGLVALQKLSNVGTTPNPAPTVPYLQTVKYARQQSHLHLLAPTHLPPGWRATSVRYVDTPDEHWHLGVLTGQDKYVGLEQADAPITAMVKKFVDHHAQHRPAVRIGGVRWAAWADSGGDYALCRRAGHTTTLVVGTATPAQLKSYAASLR